LAGRATPIVLALSLAASLVSCASDTAGTHPLPPADSVVTGQQTPGREQEESRPGAAVGQSEPGGRAEAEADRKPQRQLVPLGVGKRFEAGGQPRHPGESRDLSENGRRGFHPPRSRLSPG
jgi:hypothetical protein